MTDAGGSDPDVRWETSRLVLRPSRPEDAVVFRELWTERDPRVPPHRRIDPDGRPTVADIAARIRATPVTAFGLLTVEHWTSHDVIGYCGLNEREQTAREPELAFELLRREWNRGYATEAATAVLEWARSSGFERLWAGVWEWNVASRRVLAKLGFEEVERTHDPIRDDNLLTTLRL